MDSPRIGGHGRSRNLAAQASEDGDNVSPEESLGMTTMHGALASAERMNERTEGASNAEAQHGIIGRSRAIQQVFRLVQSVAETDVAILIRGETGTGKELIAGLI